MKRRLFGRAPLFVIGLVFLLGRLSSPGDAVAGQKPVPALASTLAGSVTTYDPTPAAYSTFATPPAPTSASTHADSTAPRSPAASRRPTLVMIHGMFVGPWCWDNYREYFEQRGYRVVTPTLRGHAATVQGPPPMELMQTGIEDYVSQVEREVEKEFRAGEEKPILIGHSMGGLIAQLLAAKGLARTVVLIAPAAPRGISPVSWPGLKSAWMNRQRLGQWGEPLRPTFEGAVYASLHLLPPEDREKVFARFTYESPRAAWQISFWFFDPKKSTAVDASRVTCPVLTIVGGEDRLVPPKVVRKIQDKYRAVSTYREFPRHSHFLIAEPGWEKVAREIEVWLRDKAGCIPNGASRSR